MKPRTVGRYEIVDELGRGNMGIVYRAHDPVIDRELAIKTVVIPEAIQQEIRAEYVERFLREARVAGKLVHPNIVITYDAATDESSEVPFIAMEMVEGESLAQRIESKGQIPWRGAIDIVIPLARALAFAAQRGIVHRDVKPGNVILTPEGVPKLTDFGLAKISTSSLTKAGVILGTPQYISPEQLRGQVLDGRSDLFSLGAVLYHMLVGTPPFSASELASIFHKVVTQDPTGPSQLIEDVPPELDPVLARALAKLPEQRYPTCSDFADDLEAVRSGERATLDSSLTLRTNSRASLSRPVPKSMAAADTDGSLIPRRSKKRRQLWLWTSAAVVLAGVVYTLGVGPTRALQQGRSLVTRLGPVGSWLDERSRAIETTVREAQAEREHRDALRERAASLLGEGVRLGRHGQWTDARAAFDRSLESWREAGDGVGEGRLLVARGRMIAEMGAWEKARAELNAAAAVCRLYEEPSCEIAAFVSLANVEGGLGHFDQAGENLGLALGIAGAQPDTCAPLPGVIAQSELAGLNGNWHEARRELEAALELSARCEAGERLRGQVALAIISVAEGRRDEAATRLLEASELCAAETGTPGCEDVPLWQARSLLAAGDTSRALSLYVAAAQQYRDTGHLPGLVAALLGQADVASVSGDTEGARALRSEALTIRAALGLEDAAPSTIDTFGLAPLAETLANPHDRFAFMLAAAPRTALSESRLQTARSLRSEAHNSAEPAAMRP